MSSIPTTTTTTTTTSDKRSNRELVEAEGYPFESYRIKTSDGYILLLERIPNKRSRKAVYFQVGEGQQLSIN